MAECYYCGEPFVDGDLAVPLPLVRYEAQDHGGAIWRDEATEKVHQHCLGDPQ